jgi:hypothetical protein
MPHTTNTCRYPWPASAITPKDMALLHSVRETAAKRVPITALVAEAVRQCYGPPQTQTHNQIPPNERKTA